MKIKYHLKITYKKIIRFILMIILFQHVQWIQYISFLKPKQQIELLSFDFTNLFLFTFLIDYQFIRYVNAQGNIKGDHIYFAPDRSSQQISLNSLIFGCTEAMMAQLNSTCSQFSLTMPINGPLDSSYPYPNLKCAIQIDCISHSFPSQIFQILSYSWWCSSKDPSNLLYYTPSPMTDFTFQLGTASFLFSATVSDLASYNQSIIQYACYIKQLNSPTNINLPYTLSTTSVFNQKFYYLCSTSGACDNVVWSNAFTLAVNPACTPSISTQPNPIYSNYVLSSALPVLMIASGTSGYASTSDSTYCSLIILISTFKFQGEWMASTDKVFQQNIFQQIFKILNNKIFFLNTLSYRLLNTDGTGYTGTDVTIDQSTGQLYINSNIIFITALMIKVTSSYSTVSFSINTSQFQVQQICGTYCTPSITGIVSSYSYTIAPIFQIILQSYATTTNPSNCIMTFSLKNSAGNSSYTGTDLSIDPTTGIISTINLNPFASPSIWITVTSTYSTLSCSGTLTSSAFLVQTQCNGYCTPVIQDSMIPIYNAQFTATNQILLQINGTTSNPINFLLTYNLFYASNNTQYQGPLVLLQSSTGKIQTIASQSFLTPLLIIQVTSQCQFTQCSGAVYSNQFQINAKKENCQKVQFIPPQNFRFLKIMSVDGPNFIYFNFSTSSPDCKIQSYTIVNSQTNLNVPIGLNQAQEGQTQFLINVNNQFINIPYLYDFYIKVQTEDGQVFFKEAQIYVDKCDQDQIFLNKSLSNINLIKTAGYACEIDVSLYFQNIYPSACPLSYNIVKVVSNDSNILPFQHGRLLKQSGKRFIILSQTDYIFRNYLIYIQASNSKISSNSSQFLIFNVSLNNAPKQENLIELQNLLKTKFQSQIRNKNSKSNIPLTQNLLNQTKYKVLIENARMNNFGILTITFNQNLTIPDFAQAALNLSSNYSINQSSFFPKKISTNETLFDILSLKQIIHFQIIRNSITDENYLKFDVKLLEWNSRKIEILFNFTYPQIISTGKKYDQLAFQILNGSNFTSNTSKVILDIFQDGFQIVDIPQQSLLSLAKQKQIALIAQSSTTSTVIIQSTFLMIMQLTISPIQKLFLNLQMQANLKYYQVAMPYQANFFIQVLNQTLEFKIDWNSSLQSIGINDQYLSYFDQYQNEVLQLPTNLQRAGIHTLSILGNIKNILIVIAIFVILNMLAPVFLLFDNSQKGLSKYLKKQLSDFKYNGLIRSITVGLLQQANTVTIIFMYYRNQDWKDFKQQSKKDQILNVSIWAFILIFLTSLPMIFYFKIHFNKDFLNDKSFIESFGILIEKMKIRKPSTKYVYPLLLLNRLVFAFIPVSFFNIPSIQIIFVILESLLYNAFIIQAKVNIDWVEYYQEVLNEFALLFMYTLLTLFGDTGLIFSLDSDISIEKKIYAHQIAGIVFSSVGILVVAVNIGLLCKKQVKTFYLYFVKYHNLQVAKLVKYYNIENKNKNESQKEIESSKLIDLKIKEQRQKILLIKPFQKLLTKEEIKLIEQKLPHSNKKNSKENLKEEKNLDKIQQQLPLEFNIDQNLMKLSYQSYINQKNTIQKIQFYQAPSLQKENTYKNQKSIYASFMNLYKTYENLIFKGHERKYPNQPIQEEIIENMAFRESDTIDQLQDKHKQLIRYLESIRDYNYSDLKDLPVYNQNRLLHNNCIANMKDDLIKKIRITKNI